VTRTPIIAGNWKMNKTPAEAADLARAFAAALGNVSGVEVVLCPPFVSLPAVHAAIQGTRLGLGAMRLCDHAGDARVRCRRSLKDFLDSYY